MKRSTPGVVMAIGLVSGGSLLLELTFVRIFSVLFFSHYAFLIISTALFGLGLAGVVLQLRGIPLPSEARPAMRKAAVLFSCTAILATLVAHIFPLKVSAALSGQITQLIYLIVFYIILGAPFYFVGVVVSIGMSVWSDEADKLYFGDLLGAGIGCLALFLALPLLRPMGTSFAVAAMGFLAALVLCEGSARGRRAALAAALLLSILGSWYAGAVVPLIPRDHKRAFKTDYTRGRIRWTRWGVLSRVDVALYSPKLAVLWIDGGTNESPLIRFSGDYARDFDREAWGKRRSSFVYQIRKPGPVAIIGPAGSHEVIAAVGFGAPEVTGIEMDPLVVQVATKAYADFIGRPYDLPNVRMVGAEGRSYLEQTPRTFDIIQQVNNFTPVALASGALNVSETYLVTVEAFQLYLNRLSPEGIIDIRRHGDIRLASVAMEAFRRQGVREPWKHIVILDDETLIKKSPWSTPELDRIRELAEKLKREIRFIPDRLSDRDSWYDGFLRSANPREWYYRDVANLAPSTDDWPFFNHYVQWGRSKDPTLPKTLAWYNRYKFFKRIPHGDFVMLSILAEAAVLSFVFLFLPLWRSRRQELSRAALLPITYFACLGMGFIFVEICLMQRLTLLLGHPSLSLAVVLCSLLIFAGLGSLCSGRMGVSTPGPLKAMLGVNICLILTAALCLPWLVNRGLTLTTAGRISLAIAITGVHGFIMGMPFPLAVRLMARNLQQIIPWGWAMNAYATVVGSVLSVVLAMFYGFSAVYLLAAGAYGIALLTCGSLARGAD
ncbi:MAG: hypothetical protein NTX71_11600 [Candidatus Aureabacteria bacterium]|nr:hypothetical protein [Candidatus Auribacterota bacterium]